MSGTFLPSDWRPADADVSYAAVRGFSPAQITELEEEFRDYWLAESGQRARKRDWAATWRTWIRRTRKKPLGQTSQVIDLELARSEEARQERILAAKRARGIKV